MNWLIKALSSTIGQKYVMAITGLLLCGFLVVHLAGNLLLYVGEEPYNNYAYGLHQQEWLVKIGEALLVLLFGAHIFLAYSTTRMNRNARPVEYERRESKQEGRVLTFAPSAWMFVTGAIVLAFLILHVADFTFEARTDIDYEGKTPFEKAVAILRNPISFSVYLIGCIILGVHLAHGVASSFQSLGANHPRYNSLIQWLGVAFAIVIAAGFASFPLWAIALEQTTR